MKCSFTLDFSPNAFSISAGNSHYVAWAYFHGEFLYQIVKLKKSLLACRSVTSYVLSLLLCWTIASYTRANTMRRAWWEDLWHSAFWDHIPSVAGWCHQPPSPGMDGQIPLVLLGRQDHGVDWHAREWPLKLFATCNWGWKGAHG